MTGVWFVPFSTNKIYSKVDQTQHTNNSIEIIQYTVINLRGKPRYTIFPWCDFLDENDQDGSHKVTESYGCEKQTVADCFHPFWCLNNEESKRATVDEGLCNPHNCMQIEEPIRMQLRAELL